MLDGLDDFDRAILRSIQLDNQKTHAALGEEIGLSGSAVRRRLAALREGGIIAADVSLIDRSKLGVTLIVQLAFEIDTPEAYDDFDLAMSSLPNVKQSYHVSGPMDYVLVVQGESLTWYEDWAKMHIMTNTNIKRHETCVVWSCKKFDTTLQV